jgi:hypothetical protein
MRSGAVPSPGQDGPRFIAEWDLTAIERVAADRDQTRGLVVVKERSYSRTSSSQIMKGANFVIGLESILGQSCFGALTGKGFAIRRTSERFSDRHLETCFMTKYIFNLQKRLEEGAGLSVAVNLLIESHPHSSQDVSSPPGQVEPRLSQ